MNEDSDDISVDAAEPELVELVSYLDGELDEETSDRFERQLVADQQLRRRADELDRTWRLLDTLEDVAASGEFTKKTLASMTVLKDMPDDATVIASAPLKKNFPLRRVITSFVAALLVSFVAQGVSRRAAENGRPQSETQILGDLEFLKSLPRYANVPDVKFLKSLELTSPPITSPTGDRP